MRVTFTRTNPGTQDPTTGQWSGDSVSTISGDAIKVRGNPQRYMALELILSTMPTLLFTSDAYPLLDLTTEFVQPGDSVVWNGLPFIVRDVDAVAPDGTCIIARIVIAAGPA